MGLLAGRRIESRSLRPKSINGENFSDKLNVVNKRHIVVTPELGLARGMLH